MQSTLTNQYLNLAFRFENEIKAAIESGRDIEKILDFRKGLKSNEIASFAQVENSAINYLPSRPQSFGSSKMVGVISIVGVLTRRDSWYGVSYEAIAEKIREFDADPQISSIVLKVYSPGGSADGNYIFADAVIAAKKVVVTHTAYCYSAAYFGACPSDLIVLDNQAASGIGSLGSMYIHTDYSKNLEEDGIKTTIIRADGSEKKALVNPYESLTEETYQMILDQTNDCRAEFIGYVNRSRRGKIKSEALTGAEFNRKTAAAVGLIDEVGSLEYAIQRSLQIKKQ